MVRRWIGKFQGHVWLAVLFLVIRPLVCQSQPSGSRLVLTGDTPWVISEEQCEAVQRALDDVRTDWYKVFGRVPVVVGELPGDYGGPAVYLGQTGKWRDAMLQGAPGGVESFVLRVQRDPEGRDVLMATGSDMRGSIYAVYAFSEEILGVDPWYYWVDKEPVRQSRIEVPGDLNKEFGNPTFKYRGWFINDEDILSRHSPDPLKENVFSLEKFDKIYETLLRLRGNMVVPATFPFPDERCQELAARRGLILNMHHILVLGLNTYRWPDDVPFSFKKHPKIMEKYWKTCIDAFRDYEVIWTVGYRGKHDRPFWRDEPELKTPEEQGKVISDAIARQVEMIRKIQPDADIIANMWWEGADLYHQGVLRIPEGVTLVWPDNGAGIIRDNGKAQSGDGIYYHTAMLNNRANQLSEMVNPGRIYNEVLRFVRAGATSFFLVNVSDVRPVPLSTDCAMKLVWDAKPFLDKTDEENMTDFLRDWSRRQFGTDLSGTIASNYREYFDISYMRRNVLEGENALHTKLRRLDWQTAPLIKEGKPLTEDMLKSCGDLLTFSKQNSAYVRDLLDRARSVFPQVPGDRRDFYRSHILTQLEVHHYSLLVLESYCRALLAYQSGDKADAVLNAESALQSSVEICSAFHQSEYGKWAAWYEGEDFVGVMYTYDLIRVLTARLKGEPVPPIRKRRGYQDVEKYQEAFSKNFPLLYPGKLNVN